MRPNLFLVGAPKCGTTSLYEHLRHHPDVFFCWPKEPGFFATDLPSLRRAEARTLRAYEDPFAGAPERARFLGDASVSYLREKLERLIGRSLQHWRETGGA